MSTQNDKLDFSQPEPDKNSMSFYADQQRNKLFARNDYNYDNPFYQNAKYKFLYNEPNDYNDAFEYASEDILKNNFNFIIYDYDAWI